MEQETLFLFLSRRRDVFCLQVVCSVCCSFWMSWRKESGRIIVRGCPLCSEPWGNQGVWSAGDRHMRRTCNHIKSASTWDLDFEKSGKRIFSSSSFPVAFFILLNWHVSQGLESITCGRSVVGFFSFHFFEALFYVRTLYSLQRHNSDLAKSCWCLCLVLAPAEGWEGDELFAEETDFSGWVLYEEPWVRNAELKCFILFLLAKSNQREMIASRSVDV